GSISLFPRAFLGQFWDSTLVGNLFLRNATEEVPDKTLRERRVYQANSSVRVIPECFYRESIFAKCK
ncbi:hypothetical protein AB4528_06490, partial [Vibrio breoganii]